MALTAIPSTIPFPPSIFRPRRAFYPVMLKPQPARASCQGRFPQAEASAFRLARSLRCRLSRLRSHTVKAPIGGASEPKGSVI